MKICLTQSYISFSLSFSNILEWWVKRTSALSRPGQCLILPCKSHNIYHSVFAKVVKKCVEWLNKCVLCVCARLCIFSLTHTHTHTPTHTDSVITTANPHKGASTGPNTVLRSYVGVIHSTLTTRLSAIISPILQVRQLRLWEVKWLVCSHPSGS